MKVRVERDVIAEAVTWCARTLPSRSSVPVLTGLLLEADVEPGRLKFSAFDFELSARIEAPADVEAAGRVLVSGRLLADIVRSLPSKPVDLVLDGSRIRLVCGSSKFTLLTMPVDDYPTLPELPGTAGVVDGALFAEAVAQVAVAASREEAPPMLAGVRLEADGDELTLLATDRYRLAMRTIPWRPSSPDLSVVALVRARTLQDSVKTMAGDVTLGLANDGRNGLLGIVDGGRQSTSLLMDGEYPRVRSLFPKEFASTAVVEVGALAEAVKRVSLVVERHTAVALAFSDGTLTLEGGKGEDASASEVLEASLSGPEVTIGFNPQYLLDGLTSLHTPFVRVQMVAAGKPAVLTGAQGVDGPVDEGYRYLLMPMRL